MNKLQRIIQLEELSNYYTHSPSITAVINRAIYLLNEGQISEALEEIKKVPTSEVLLSNLLDKLKHKSVYKTVKNIHDVSDVRKLIGYSSLITHVAIECEQGNLEYAMLLPHLLERQNGICYQMMGQGRSKMSTG